MLKDTIVQLAADIKDGKMWVASGRLAPLQSALLKPFVCSGELWMVEYMTVTAVVLSAFYLYSALVAQWDALPVGTGSV